MYFITKYIFCNLVHLVLSSFSLSSFCLSPHRQQQEQTAEHAVLSCVPSHSCPSLSHKHTSTHTHTHTHTHLTDQFDSSYSVTVLYRLTDLVPPRSQREGCLSRVHAWWRGSAEPAVSPPSVPPSSMQPWARTPIGPSSGCPLPLPLCDA